MMESYLAHVIGTKLNRLLVEDPRAYWTPNKIIKYVIWILCLNRILRYSDLRLVLV